MRYFSERAPNLLTFQAVRRATDPSEGRRVIAEAMSPVLVSLLPERKFELMRQKLLEMPEPSSYRRLRKDDWLAAVGVLFLVFLSTFPVVIPSMFFKDATRALRVSNGVAIVMLFLSGYGFADYAGLQPWKTGLAMVVLGAATVGGHNHVWRVKDRN